VTREENLIMHIEATHSIKEISCILLERMNAIFIQNSQASQTDPNLIL
jgi:hypothetical protein